MQNRIKILVIGDIVGKGARNAFINYLPQLKKKYEYDIISVNVENVTHGRGLNYKHYCALNNAKIDVMTMGNHIFDDKEIFTYIDKTNNLVVPGNINYQEEKFNNHKEVVVNFNDYKIKFINLVGQSIMKDDVSTSDPKSYFDSIYDNDSIYVVDYHAEFTLEKNLLGYYLDGRASLVYGTHTHVQTADERILPNKTAFISDVGMCGSIDSIIGYDYQSFLDRISNNTKTYVSERKPLMVNGLLVEIDLNSKEAVSILRINEKM